MARIAPLAKTEISPELKTAFEKHCSTYNARITNMKATLGHSPLAFEVYMEWYRLYERIQAILGERLAYLYAYSISKSSNCPLCTTFFRKIIIDNGEQPENIQFTDLEQLLIDFGSAISLYQGRIHPLLFDAVGRFYTARDIVDLTAFAGQMIATNIFSNVTETDIDEYLSDYISWKQFTPHGY
jgi:hypothetical protein